MPTVFITGANRGIGLELATQYAADGWRVIATCRNPEKAPELSATGAEIHTLDVSDLKAIKALAEKLTNTPIDVLINNAGSMGQYSFASDGLAAQAFGTADYEDWEALFRINVIAPLAVMEAFIDHVESGEQKKIVTFTSMAGSNGLNTQGSLIYYRSSKAAANNMMRSVGIELSRRGVIALAVHPGWAKTRMGGDDAPVEVPECVTGIRSLIADLTLTDAGKFRAYDGSEMPW